MISFEFFFEFRELHGTLTVLPYDLEALLNAKQRPCTYAQVKANQRRCESGTPTQNANKPSLGPLWVGQPPVSDNTSLRPSHHESHPAK